MTLIYNQHFPLNNTWTLSYKSINKKDWSKDFKNVIDINDIETFWKVFNNIKDIVELEYGFVYSFFKRGIGAMWEHPKNINGHTIHIYLNKNHMSDKEQISLYTDTLIVLVGNTLNCSKYINGVTFDKKFSGVKISFWVSMNQDHHLLSEIKKELGLYTLEKERKVCISMDDNKQQLTNMNNKSNKKRPVFI